jgi:hypothetical protein
MPVSTCFAGKLFKLESGSLLNCRAYTQLPTCATLAPHAAVFSVKLLHPGSHACAPALVGEFVVLDQAI